MLWLRCARPTTAELGLAGESIAARYLARDGLRLIGRRLRTPLGELDLVFRDPASRTLVVAEVKTRRTRSDRPLEDMRWRPAGAVGERDRDRLVRACARLARELRFPRARLELVEVLVRTGGGRRIECRRHQLATTTLRTTTPGLGQV